MQSNFFLSRSYPSDKIRPGSIQKPIQIPIGLGLDFGEDEGLHEIFGIRIRQNGSGSTKKKMIRVLNPDDLALAKTAGFFLNPDSTLRIKLDKDFKNRIH